MRTARIIAVVGLTVAAMAMPAAALGGGGGHGGSCQAYAEGDSAEVVLQDNCFGPISATAGPGSTLTISNEGQQSHTYTAVDGSFDTGVVLPGGSTTIELPSTLGTLPVYCTLHADAGGNGMAGTITLAATSDPVTGSADLGSSALLLAGGFVLGSATVAARRRRAGQSDTQASAL